MITACSSINLRGCTRMDSKLHQKVIWSNPDDNWLGSLIRFCGRFVYKSPPVYLSIQYWEYLLQKQSSPRRTHTRATSILFMNFNWRFMALIWDGNLLTGNIYGTRETYWAVYTQHPYLWLIVSLYIRLRFSGLVFLFSPNILDRKSMFYTVH